MPPIWGGEKLTNPEDWLFRIAHSTALDFLCPHAGSRKSGGALDPEFHGARSARFGRIDPNLHAAPAAQRSMVVMKDMLGYSLEEIAAVNDVSAPAAKSALQRGRAALRGFIDEPEDVQQTILPEEMGKRLAVCERLQERRLRRSAHHAFRGRAPRPSVEVYPTRKVRGQ